MKQKNSVLLLIFLNLSGFMNAQTMGLITQTDESQDGYVLFAPNFSTNTYLIDKCGREVHSWPGTHFPGQSVYLLEDGSLLRTGRIPNQTFNAGGLGGIIERFDWNGNLVWSYSLSSSTECMHHDICMLPNGNILAISYDLKTANDALEAGCDPTLYGENIWSDKIVEIQPIGSNSGTIVWEWRAWDHLVQDYDPSKPNYAQVGDHPEWIDVNYNLSTQSDWLHCNAIDYNADLDQIIISSHNQNEFWIIDHSTTTEESAGHSGGNHGRGGDLLYRWGNPAAYARGEIADQKLFGQHHVHWIASALEDAGKIMIFNNGVNRPQGAYSTVEVLTSPMTINGDYLLNDGVAYEPATSDWTYMADNPTDFFGMNISGAQRLPNGNTLICQGPNGTFFEINPANEIVWKYICPVGAQGNILTQGNNPTQNSVFRATLLAANFPGLTGQSLTPGAPIELNPLDYVCEMTNAVHELSARKTNYTAINPFDQTIQLIVESGMENACISLHDLNGNKICEWNNLHLASAEKISLPLIQEIPPGMYYLRIQNSFDTHVIKLVHE